MAAGGRSFRYNSSDAWVLLAIVYAGRDAGATLADVVGAADAINHAILTHAEVGNALFKLTRDGLVAHEGDRLFPTAATMELYRASATTRRRSMLGDLDQVRRFLDSTPWTGDDELRKEHDYAGVTAEDFHAAVKAYHERAAAVFARPGKKPRKAAREK